MVANYWVVGAMWDGRDDQMDRFVREGYWRLGWSEADQPGMASLRDSIQVGDRIAIKRMLGRGSPTIEIRAIGVVTGIEPDKRILVRWAAADIAREVPSHGRFASIHGPLDQNDEWTVRAFQL